MKPNYTNKTPRAALAVLAVAATVMVGLFIEGLAQYTAGPAAQASLSQLRLIASAK